MGLKWFFDNGTSCIPLVILSYAMLLGVIARCFHQFVMCILRASQLHGFSFMFTIKGIYWGLVIRWNIASCMKTWTGVIFHHWHCNQWVWTFTEPAWISVDPYKWIFTGHGLWEELIIEQCWCNSHAVTYLLYNVMCTLYYKSSSVCLSVCLFVCSPTPPRSFDGSSPNLLGVCRWTSELPLRGSFLKRSTGQRVKRHFFGADDTRLRPHRCKRHTASKSLITSTGIITS